MNRHWRCLAALAAAALLTAPGRDASAQTAGDEQPRPATLRLGPFDLRPRLVLSNVGVDDNVFNEFENEKRDFTATVSPELEVGLSPGRLRTTFLAASDFVYFQKYTSERSVNRSFTARAELDLTILRPFVTYTAAHTSARSGNEIDARARRHPRSMAGGSRFLISARTALTLAARRTEEAYDREEAFREVDLATTLNSTTTTYDGALQFELTPLTTLSLSVAKEETRFEFSPLRDADSLRIAPTLTFSPLGLLTGTASAGYRRLEGRDASLPPYEGLSASGSLGVVLAGRFKLESSFTHDVRFSYEPLLPYYVQSGARATLTTQVAGGLDVRGTFGRETMSYRAFDGSTAPGRDVVNVYGGGFGYRLAEHAQFAVTIELADRESARDITREYRNNRIFASLNWGATTR